ncbi:5-formyltetrahydrofolate cyclo-ligase [Paenibacillus provencensis]|uniref:5-formyltetrahydrofolate cyclo-ligase n=1 Tax=Paenibacillus provencensis TaxID=441151 RepID=A0ABW3PZL9_9BACL|nr:5-formyltetrahydrofolate cyclo-ligase [Paenibacillus sp. MER 78]MCM3127685.1 5-formyltetrahydrofolate cyclo-ligase [Paenibacillus sp. MER 78]
MEMDQQLDSKKQLRSKMHRIRNDLSIDIRLQISEKLCEQAIHEIEQLRILKNKDRLVVFSYIAYRSEADTSLILKHGFEQQDIVLVPRVTEDSSLMELRRIQGMQDAQPGRWGIHEPADHTEVWERERWTDIDLVIVPGLAYDHRGGRIGYGGGYYDRFAGEVRARSLKLQRSNQQVSEQMTEQVIEPVYAGLVLPGQLLPPGDIPMEPQDFRLNMLFTEHGVLHIQ